MLEERTFSLWGGLAQVITDECSLDTALAEIRDEIALVDRVCSTFRDDSCICRVNVAAGRWIDVDPTFSEALEVALSMAEATGGLVDPTVGSATLATEDLEVRMDADWRCVQTRGRRVKIPRGVKLDLGATAKAWCADRAARRASRATGSGVLVALCGDVAVEGEPPADGWVITCGDDHRAVNADCTNAVRIIDGGLATSSTTVRRGPVGRTHIVHPHTLGPIAGPWRTVSVAARSCVEANAATTAALVRGEDAADWLARFQLPARLVTHDGRVTTTEGWPR